MFYIENIILLMRALLIPIIALVILLIVANYMLFKKAGEAGWKALIPLYNTYTMIRIAHGDKKMWLMLGVVFTLIAPLISNTLIVLLLNLFSLVVNSYLSYTFIKRYSSTGMAVAGLFIPDIIYPIVAFSRSYQYSGPLSYQNQL